MWEEIVYPFSNFNGCTVEVWELISNFMPHFIGHVISYACWDLIRISDVIQMPMISK